VFQFENGKTIDVSGSIDFGRPMIVEAMHALRESHVARMTLVFRASPDGLVVDLCDVRPVRGVRCTAKWRRRALRHRSIAAEAAYGELQAHFVSPCQRYEDFVAKAEFVPTTGEVKVSKLRFLKPHFPFPGWRNELVLR
jgi:hypothetical protein